MATSIPDIDLPPSFPLAHSVQRASAGDAVAPRSAASNKTAPSFSVSGPSGNATGSTTTSSSSSSKVQALRDVLAVGDGDGATSSSSKSSSLGVPSRSNATLATAPTASSSSLMPPPSTSRSTAPPGVGGAPTSSSSLSAPTSSSSNSLTPPNTTSKRKKVILTPGHSPLDWARLKATLTPPFPFRKIPLSEVKQHKRLTDPGGAWTVLNGKVYDLSAYVGFHPGGEEELMRVAGRDGTRLFMLTHSWVNVDAIVDGCCIGVAVKDD